MRSWLPRKCVVVPFDFSERSARSLETARAFVADLADLHVVHVVAEALDAAHGMAWDATDHDPRSARARIAYQGSALSDRLGLTVEPFVIAVPAAKSRLKGLGLRLAIRGAQLVHQQLRIIGMNEPCEWLPNQNVLTMCQELRPLGVDPPKSTVVTDQAERRRNVLLADLRQHTEELIVSAA